MVAPCWGGCHGCSHGDAKGAVRDSAMGWVVGERSCSWRVVHPRVGEPGVRQGGKGAERPL